jgi:hypothetical protein
MSTHQAPVIVQRDQWGARHSAGRSPMPRRVSTIYLHHTVTRATNDPCRDMRHVENVLASRGLAPGYSFVFHPSGVVLVGAGPMKGAHTAGQNGSSYGFAFLGNYDETEPGWPMFASAGFMLNLLRWLGAVPADLSATRLLGHKNAPGAATACPGRHLAPRVEAVRWWAGVLGS